MDDLDLTDVENWPDYVCFICGESHRGHSTQDRRRPQEPTPWSTPNRLGHSTHRKG